MDIEKNYFLVCFLILMPPSKKRGHIPSKHSLHVGSRYRLPISARCVAELHIRHRADIGSRCRADIESNIGRMSGRYKMFAGLFRYCRSVSPSVCRPFVSRPNCFWPLSWKNISYMFYISHANCSWWGRNP